MSEWISVKDRVPKEGESVLIYWDVEGKPVYMCGYWVPDADKKGNWTVAWMQSWTANDAKPTHWMPLPEPPKEGENNE